MTSKISSEQFRSFAKTWINNKIILSQKSQWYNIPARKDAIYHLKSMFSSFLSFPAQYNIGQLAVKIKQHEDLLMAALPNPHNASYLKALETLNDLIDFSQEFITTHNLQDLIKH